MSSIAEPSMKRMTRLHDLSSDERNHLFALLERICVALETSESREVDR